MSARRDKRWAPHCGHDPARGRRHNSRVGEQAITARSCRAPSSNAATTCRGKRVCRTLHVVDGARRVRTSVERRRPRRRRVRREKRESACKPGSVRPTRGRPRQPFIWDARHRASRATYPNPTRATSSDSYLVLLQVGFTLPRVLPRARCALTAPFHPYPEPAGVLCGAPTSIGRYIFCGTFRRLTPPRRYLAPCPVEPGLSSRRRSAKQRRVATQVRGSKPTLLRRQAPSDCPANSRRRQYKA